MPAQNGEKPGRGRRPGPGPRLTHTSIPGLRSAAPRRNLLVVLLYLLVFGFGLFLLALL